MELGFVLFIGGNVAEAAIPQNFVALPDAFGGIRHPVGVGAHGDDLAAHVFVKPQNLRRGEGAASVPDAGTVDLDALAAFDHGFQQLFDLVSVARQAQALVLPLLADIAAHIADVGQNIVITLAGDPEELVQIVVQDMLAEFRAFVFYEVVVAVFRRDMQRAKNEVQGGMACQLRGQLRVEQGLSQFCLLYTSPSPRD